MNPSFSAIDNTSDQDPASAPGGEQLSGNALTPVGDLTAAYDLLGRVVGDLAEKGRVPTAAGLKSAIQRRAPFDEQSLGFTSFREFLRAAEAAGKVKLVEPAPRSGLDVTITLPSTATSGQGPLGQTAPLRQIRHDLWTAFVDWRPDFERVWDLDDKRAYIVRRNAGSGDDLWSADVRRRIQTMSDRLVPITGISMRTQLGWMAEFVAGVKDEEVKGKLTAALQHDRPAATFTTVLRSEPEEFARWTATRFDRVERAVRSWMAERSLEIDLFARVPPARRGPGLDKSTPRVGTPDASGEALRDQVVSAVARMPLSELLRLPIPAEYLLIS